jgi:hypothetical protein
MKEASRHAQGRLAREGAETDKAPPFALMTRSTLHHHVGRFIGSQ